jgi:hypothetical protein
MFFSPTIINKNVTKLVVTKTLRFIVICCVLFMCPILCEVTAFTFLPIWLSTIRISAIYDVMFDDLLKGIC